jgi:VIT1/CCC1 family predicted Fe2+/Mn2+ transporter
MMEPNLLSDAQLAEDTATQDHIHVRRSEQRRHQRGLPLILAETFAGARARMSGAAATTAPRPDVEKSFLLQRVQPALTGLIDGSLSTLAPIFAVALATHQTRYAFFAGLATAIGAGVSMAFSEGLSDTGELTGRGSAYRRGAITGAGTFLGGILHTLPFLITQYRVALIVAVAVITFELLTLSWIRSRFFGTGFLGSFVSVTLGGAIIVAISAALGGVAG